LSNGQLTGERLSARFEVNSASKAVQLFGQFAASRRSCNEFAQAAAFNGGGGLDRLFSGLRKRLNHFRSDKFGRSCIRGRNKIRFGRYQRNNFTRTRILRVRKGNGGCDLLRVGEGAFGIRYSENQHRGNRCRAGGGGLTNHG
jgi:hypothetical protein